MTTNFKIVLYICNKKGHQKGAVRRGNPSKEKLNEYTKQNE